MAVVLMMLEMVVVLCSFLVDISYMSNFLNVCFALL